MYCALCVIRLTIFQAELKILNKEIKLNLETADSLKDQKEKLILQVEAGSVEKKITSYFLVKQHF